MALKKLLLGTTAILGAGLMTVAGTVLVPAHRK